MNLLEAARCIAELQPTRPHGWPDPPCDECVYCEAVGPHGQFDVPIEHKPECPWLQMPKIVEALKVLEDISRGFHDADEPCDMDIGTTPCACQESMARAALKGTP